MEHFESRAIREQLERSQYLEHSAPIYLTSSFVFEDAEDMRASFAEEKQRNIYSRFSNPNVEEFVKKLAIMEGAEDGYAFASGMAAIFSTLAALLSAGDHILACRSLFGSTHSLLTKYFPKWGIGHTYFDANRQYELKDLLTENTKIIYIESPTNPAMDILDLDYLGRFAKENNLIFIVDNCFATPYLQQPLAFGADLSIHSATKLIDGQGRVLGGAVLGRQDLIREIYLFSRNSGPALSPFHAWLLSKSLETLAVRLDRHCENALNIAQRLEQNAHVAEVRYPFLASHPQVAIAKKQMKAGGALLSFELKNGLRAGQEFMDALQLCSRTANLGDTRSIVTHPASTTHSKLSPKDRAQVGISDGLVRCSIGLEHVEDIWADFEQALDKVSNAQ